MNINVKSKDFKNLQGTPILIKKVYNFYRSGYIPAENKFHTYIYFPARLTDEVVYSEDRVLTEVVEGEKMELREKTWNKEDRKFEFRKLKSAANADFYKSFAKVIDIVAVANGEFETTMWNPDTKTREPYLVSPWEEFVIEAFSAWKVRDLLDTMELAEDIPLDATSKKRPFDWEDNIRKRLEGKAFTFKTTGAGLETRYRYKEVPAFEATVAKPQELSIEDVPF